MTASVPAPGPNDSQRSGRPRPPRSAVFADAVLVIVGLALLWWWSERCGAHSLPAIVAGAITSFFLLGNVYLRSRGASSILLLPEIVWIIGGLVWGGLHGTSTWFLLTLPGVVVLDLAPIFLHSWMWRSKADREYWAQKNAKKISP